jgi:hypothetical protein
MILVMALFLVGTIRKGSPTSIPGSGLFYATTTPEPSRAFDVARLDKQKRGTNVWETLSAIVRLYALHGDL